MGRKQCLDTAEHEAEAGSRWLARVMVVAIALATFTASLTAYYLPPERGEFGVIFAPWADQTVAFGAVVAAGGAVAGAWRFYNIVVVHADDTDFVRRVMANGAWAVTAARGLCSPPEEIA